MKKIQPVSMINQQISFKTFYKLVCKALSGKGEVENFTLINCRIQGVPKNYPLIRVEPNFLWFKPSIRLCGFKVGSGVNVYNNHFV
jgi:hypothetical protein